MDRERAETFLRLLAEAELRDLSPPPLHAGGATDFPFFTVPVTVRRAAGALIAVDALDVPTTDAILTDVELALGLRQQGEPTEPGHPAPVGAMWLRRLTAPHQRPWRSPVPLSQPPAVVAGRPSGFPGASRSGWRSCFTTPGTVASLTSCHTRGPRPARAWWPPGGCPVSCLTWTSSR